MHWFIEETGGAHCIIDSIEDLYVKLLAIVTLDNFTKIIVYEFNSGEPGMRVYKFNPDASTLYVNENSPFYNTPTIKKKLVPSPVQEVPISVPIEPLYLIITNNTPKEMTYDNLLKEIKTKNIDALKRLNIYDLLSKILYKFSEKKKLFVSECGKDLSSDLTNHLSVNYKMMIVSADNLNNPFELTTNYMFESNALFNDDEFDEMNNYRLCQLPQIHGGKFKFQDLCKGYLVRIFILKNDICIGMIDGSGLSYKGTIQITKFPLGEFESCRQNILKYYEYIKEFKNRPIKEIQDIYNSINCITDLNSNKGHSLLSFSPNVLVHNQVTNNANQMVDIMAQVNELRLAFVSIKVE